MRINVRNMVCRNCVRNLHRLLEEQGLKPVAVALGYAEIEAGNLDKTQWVRLEKGLQELGFERITHRDTRITEEVKRCILAYLFSDEPCRKKLSCLIEETVGQDYNTVSRLFIYQNVSGGGSESRRNRLSGSRLGRPSALDGCRCRM